MGDERKQKRTVTHSSKVAKEKKKKKGVGLGHALMETIQRRRPAVNRGVSCEQN